MLLNRTIAKILAATLIGAGLSYVIQTRVLNKKKFEPISSALCFLNENYKSSILAQIDGKQISKDTVPPDLYFSYLQAESEAAARLTQIARQVAARVERMPSTEQKAGPLQANDLKPIERYTVPEQSIRDYYEQNKNAFPGVGFEKVSNLIRSLLEQRENEFRLKSKMDALEAENRFQVLSPMPCGGKVELPYSNALPGQGNTTSNFNLLYTYSYECVMCRQDIYELRRFLSQNMAQMRLWLLPVPGKKGTKNYLQSAALQCSHMLNSANIMAVHEDLLTSPISAGQEKEGKNELIKMAEKHGYNPEQFKKCIESDATELELKKYQDFADLYKINGSFPQYFLNGRGMETISEKNLVERLKFILEEKDRLREHL